MNKRNNKLYIHFDTNEVNVYEMRKSYPFLLKTNQLFFNETLVNEELFKKIDMTINNLKATGFDVNNENIRLYATGIFQEFSNAEKTQLVIHVFVNFGLYFNIINKDLEDFYLKSSIEQYGKKNIIFGITKQEFRKVVVCGSFQQNMQEISNIIEILNRHNIQVLSPWTTQVVKESLGTDFILLEGQELYNERDSWRHKYDHMNKFNKADAVIVCNPNGIIGKGTMFEFGYMVACSKRIIFTKKPTELPILFPYEIGLDLYEPID